MAWALCQIVTVVPSNIERYQFTEVYTNYYGEFAEKTCCYLPNLLTLLLHHRQ